MRFTLFILKSISIIRITMSEINQLDKTFKSFIESCTKQDLDFIASNELSDKEIIDVLLNKDEEIKKNILDNFNVKH